MKRLIKQIRFQRFLILIIIIWLLLLTASNICAKAKYPTFTEAENELIIELEEIPISEL